MYRHTHTTTSIYKLTSAYPVQQFQRTKSNISTRSRKLNIQKTKQMIVDDIVMVIAFSAKQIYLEAKGVVKYNVSNSTHSRFFQK